MNAASQYLHKLENLTDIAIQAPEELLDIVMGRNTSRPSGLLLTQQQLVNLMHYETAAKALPTEIRDVITFLGFRSGAGRGLEPSDFRETFSTVKSHAARWPGLRSDVAHVSTRLKLFAVQIATFRQLADELYEDLRGRDSHVEELKHELLGFLQDVIQAVQERERETTAIKKQLDDFAIDLANKVLPAVQLRLSAIDNNQLSSNIKRLSATIDDRARQIREKTAEYNKLVGVAVGTGVLLLGAGIYFGVQADNIRRKLNSLKSAQSRDINALSDQDQTLGSLQRTRDFLQNLQYIVIDAELSTRNLSTVWDALHIYVKASAEVTEKINDTRSLRQIINSFRQVAAPWALIMADAEKLEEVFTKADTQYLQESRGQ